MAKKAMCDKCEIKWDIREKDQTPLHDLECPYCHGPVRRIYSPCRYPLAKGEPILSHK
ncbi:hypothetical protein KKF82_09105 [Patescibacteria group bacterium]|nr:hypothetical protein [Patescibacteria group bacterium]